MTTDKLQALTRTALETRTSGIVNTIESRLVEATKDCEFECLVYFWETGINIRARSPGIAGVVADPDSIQARVLSFCRERYAHLKPEVFEMQAHWHAHKKISTYQYGIRLSWHPQKD